MTFARFWSAWIETGFMNWKGIQVCGSLWSFSLSWKRLGEGSARSIDVFYEYDLLSSFGAKKVQWRRNDACMYDLMQKFSAWIPSKYYFSVCMYPNLTIGHAILSRQSGKTLTDNLMPTFLNLFVNWNFGLQIVQIKLTFIKCKIVEDIFEL